MTRDHAVHRSQSQSGAVTQLLGGEERLEHATPHALGHSHTGVGDIDRDAAAGGHRLGQLALTRLDVFVASAKGQGTTLGHRVARVHSEVEQRTLQLRGITDDIDTTSASIDIDVHATVDGAAEKLRRKLYQLLQRLELYGVIVFFKRIGLSDWYRRANAARDEQVEMRQALLPHLPHFIADIEELRSSPLVEDKDTLDRWLTELRSVE